jgi:hypothetical protein
MLANTTHNRCREELMRKNPPSAPSRAQFSAKTQKLYHPSTQFSKPTEIIDDPALSKEEKKRALDTWEQDARQLITASNGGMPGKEEGLHADDQHRLGEVGRAKSKIGAKLKHKSAH